MYPSAGSTRPHAPTAAGPHDLSYDAAGNRTSKNGGGFAHTLAWNAENKLGRATVGALAHDYLDAADDGRVLKVVPQVTGDKITRYLGPDAEFDDTGKWTKYIDDHVNASAHPALALIRKLPITTAII